MRLTRAAVMSELGRDYVTAARLAGARPAAADVRHRAAQLHGAADRSGDPGFFLAAILDAAALGFLGLGVQPPTPNGAPMLASARDYIERAWWVVSLPGLTILLSVLAINLMGDGLRDALDPKLKNAQGRPAMTMPVSPGRAFSLSRLRGEGPGSGPRPGAHPSAPSPDPLP